MVHQVARSTAEDGSALIGVPRATTIGDRMHLEVAHLLLARKLVTLTGLARGFRQAAEWGSSLAQTLIATGQVRPFDYYRAVADVYGLEFVDLRAEPIDPELVVLEDRADYAERQVVPWRRAADGRLLLATPEITTEHFLWADAKFGEDKYDFVITSPSTSCGRRRSCFATGTAFSRARHSIRGSRSTRRSSPSRGRRSSRSGVCWWRCASAS